MDGKARFRFLAPLAFIYLLVVLLTAWVSDDAFITFRSIENLVHGYGLVFNVGERVQTFTHPLWLFAQTVLSLPLASLPAPFNLNRLFASNLLLSLLLSITTIALFGSRWAGSTRAALVGMLALILSKAYIDYSTSGLENPLSHLLVAGFAAQSLQDRPATPARIFGLSFLAGLAMLTRLDLGVLVLPPLVYLLWMSREKQKALLAVGLGLTPLFLWESFSLWYYGFLFPNTAYAKINPEIGTLALVRQGWHYFENSIRLDPITLTITGVAVAAGLFSRRPTFFALATAIVLYLGYVLWIGGDFMSGRYFSLPFLVAVLMISRLPFSDRQFAGAFLLVAVMGALPFLWGIERRPSYGQNRENNLVFIDDHKIADERMVYADRTSLPVSLRGDSPKIVYSNEKWAYQPDLPGKVELFGALGLNAYRAGPNVHAIDRNGLADPLMARLPLVDHENWRIGHFHHRFPDGYQETLESGSNLIADPQIAEYYDLLSLATRGPLWSEQRMQAILALNTGGYDHLLR